jgi:hypothetical protein
VNDIFRAFEFAQDSTGAKTEGAVHFVGTLEVNEIPGWITGAAA